MTIKDSTLEKLEKIKALKKLSTDEALEYLVEMGLERMEEELATAKRSRGTKGRAVSIGTRKEIYQRAKCKCEYPGCNEQRNLEIEHIKPWAKGGNHDSENLLLYCKAHNQRAAIKEFGRSKMSRYLSAR